MKHLLTHTGRLLSGCGLVCSGVSQTDFKDLETIFSKVTKEKQVFERLVVSKQEALELFQYNAFK